MVAGTLAAVGFVTVTARRAVVRGQIFSTADRGTIRRSDEKVKMADDS